VRLCSFVAAGSTGVVGARVVHFAIVSVAPAELLETALHAALLMLM
jgi:hypothetical protein